MTDPRELEQLMGAEECVEERDGLIDAHLPIGAATDFDPADARPGDFVDDWPVEHMQDVVA